MVQPWGTQPSGALPELGSQGQVGIGLQPPVLTAMLERWARNISAHRDRDRVVTSPQAFLWGALSLQHSHPHGKCHPSLVSPSHGSPAAQNTAFLFCRKKIRFAFLFSVWNGNK